MTDTKATPRPWRTHPRAWKQPHDLGIYDANDRIIANIGAYRSGEEAEAIRAGIIQAVNAHDAMRDAVTVKRARGETVMPAHPQHLPVCDALGCGVSCPIAAMRDGLRAAELLLTSFANKPPIYKAAPASIMHALRKVESGLAAAADKGE